MKIPEGWPTREMVDAAWRELWSSNESEINSAEKITNVLVKALAVAPTPAQEDESVAWVNSSDLIMADHDRKRYGKGAPDMWKWRAVRSDYHNTPLYTRPDSDGLRKSAEDALAIFDSASRFSLGFERAMENLRVELAKSK